MLLAMAVPNEVVDLATACIASVNATVGIELDFTPETLPLLDHYAKEVLDCPEDELLALTAPMCGAYFGEVVRRRFEAARWHAPAQEHALWRIEFERVFLYFNPVGVALDVILETNGPYASELLFNPKDEELITSALAVYSDIRETDYFTFSVRLEALEQVVLNMGAAADDKHRIYGSGDYANAAKKSLN
ncbi:MAG: hypothetical protein ACI9KE_003161 [Polyangiales bacterium]|jgi:hypothetical protein